MSHRRKKPRPNVKQKGVHQMNHWFFNKLFMVALITGLVIASAAGAVFAGTGEQKAKIDLVGTGDAGATGEAELQIRGGEFNFEAKVEGLTAGGDVSFCLNTLLIDTENVEDGKVELNEDEADGDPIEKAPTSILGQVSITKATIEEDCTGDVLLEGNVSSSDLE